MVHLKACNFGVFRVLKRFHFSPNTKGEMALAPNPSAPLEANAAPRYGGSTLSVIPADRIGESPKAEKTKRKKA